MRFNVRSVGFVVAVALAATVPAAGTSAATRAGTPVSVRATAYGNILVGPGGFVLYMFAPDRPSKSRCYGACARFWHPVLTKGRPQAGPGVKASLLGTTTRKDGKVQVTYNRHPLYFDNQTGETNHPGEVGCQQLNVNGGIWLIMKPNGQPNRAKAKPHE